MLKFVMNKIWPTGLEEESSVGRQGETEELKTYEEFSETLHQFTRYSGWRELSSFNYGDQSNACNIISSIEFNKDGEVFAVGGVTKKIKVSSYTYLVTENYIATKFCCLIIIFTNFQYADSIYGVYVCKSQIIIGVLGKVWVIIRG